MNFNSLLGERLKAERSRCGHTQATLAENANISREMLGKYERGIAEPGAGVLMSLAGAGVDVNFVLTGVYGNQSSHSCEPGASSTKKRGQRLSGSVPAPIDDEDTIRVPVMSATGSMGSGNDLVAEDVVLGEVPLSRRWLSQHLPNSRPSALRLMHAYGDSMRGTLESGDFALVDTDVQSVEIDGVYVLQAHSRLFIKRVRQRMDGCYEVSSDNPAIKQTDILNGKHEVRVCGRVVYGWNGRRF